MTNCALPPELDDKTLFRYLDGEMDYETLSHLERCTYCRERAAALDHFQKRLTGKLYRVDCPSPMTLAEAKLRMLSDPERLVIEQHVRSCPHCTREVAELETFWSAVSPQTGMLSPLKVITARLMGTEEDQKSTGLSLTPAFTGLRGKDKELFIFQAENIQIIIDVQKDAEQPELKVILGLVAGLETSEYMIEASQAGQLIATSSIDEIGNFLLPHLVTGIYELTLRGPTIEIRIPYFTI